MKNFLSPLINFLFQLFAALFAILCLTATVVLFVKYIGILAEYLYNNPGLCLFIVIAFIAVLRLIYILLNLQDDELLPGDCDCDYDEELGW